MSSVNAPRPNSREPHDLDRALARLGGRVDRALREGLGRCGHYTLLNEIGEGAYGVIYAAVADPPISRRVAIKILKRGLDTDDILERFALEERVLGRLEHPTIAPILDAGRTEDGRPWFAMPLFDGGALTTECDELSLSIDSRLRHFIEVCEGVHAAHVRGVIHRDLKPSNILLVNEVNGTRTIRLIDFGIARAIEGDTPTLRTQTAHRGRLGTPAFMAPEQRSPDGSADARSDVYSLGVVLAGLLVGTEPSVGDCEHPSLGTLVRVEMLRDPAQARRIAENRAETSADALVRRVRGDLDRIVRAATMPEPHLRYQSAATLGDDVRRFLNHEPIAARAPGTLYVLGRLCRRHRVATAVLAVSVVAFAALGTTAVVNWVEARRQSAIAEAAAARSQDVRSVLESAFGEIGTSVALGRDRQMLMDLLGRTTDSFMPSLDARDPIATAEVAAILGKAWTDLAQPVRAIEVLDAAIARLDNADTLLAQALDREVALARAEVLLRLGLAHEAHLNRRLGVVPSTLPRLEAQEFFRQALALLAAHDALAHPTATECAYSLWRSRTPWPDGTDFDAFERWLEPTILALPMDSAMRWGYLLRKAEINGWEQLLRQYHPLVEAAARQFGAKDPRVLRWRCRLHGFYVCATAEANQWWARGSDPDWIPADAPPGLREYWLRAIDYGETLIPDASEVYGEGHRLALAARVWHAYARREALAEARSEIGTAAGWTKSDIARLEATDAGREHAQLREAIVAAEGDESPLLKALEDPFGVPWP